MRHQKHTANDFFKHRLNPGGVRGGALPEKLVEVCGPFQEEAFVDGLINDDEKVASSTSSIPNSRLECKTIPYLRPKCPNSVPHF